MFVPHVFLFVLYVAHLCSMVPELILRYHMNKLNNYCPRFCQHSFFMLFALSFVTSYSRMFISTLYVIYQHLINCHPNSLWCNSADIVLTIKIAHSHRSNPSTYCMGLKIGYYNNTRWPYLCDNNGLGNIVLSQPKDY